MTMYQTERGHIKSLRLQEDSYSNGDSFIDKDEQARGGYSEEDWEPSGSPAQEEDKDSSSNSNNDDDEYEDD